MNYEYEIRYAIIDEREHYYLDSYYPNNLPKMTKNNNISLDNILKFNFCPFMSFRSEYEAKHYIQYMLYEAKENKKKYSPNIFLYDFHFCDNSTIVDIDYLITLLTIIDEGDIYIPPQITKPIVIKNDNSIGILMQCKPSDETAEIFAKRDKEFKYVD